MKFNLYLTALAVGLAGLGACREKEKVAPITPDTEKPVITPQEPVGTGAVVLHSGDTLHMEGLVTDNVKVHEIHIELYNAVTQAEPYHEHIHGASRSETYHKHFILPAVEDTLNLVLSIGAEDPEGNYVQLKRDVVVLP